MSENFYSKEATRPISRSASSGDLRKDSEGALRLYAAMRRLMSETCLRKSPTTRRQSSSACEALRLDFVLSRYAFQERRRSARAPATDSSNSSHSRIQGSASRLFLKILKVERATCPATASAAVRAAGDAAAVAAARRLTRAPRRSPPLNIRAKNSSHLLILLKPQTLHAAHTITRRARFCLPLTSAPPEEFKLFKLSALSVQLSAKLKQISSE